MKTVHAVTVPDIGFPCMNRIKKNEKRHENLTWDNKSNDCNK